MKTFSSKEIQSKYNAMASSYDVHDALSEWLGIRKLRRQMLQAVSGKVLELACGTGKNLSYYPNSVELLAVDLSPAMLAQARKKAQKLNRAVSFAVMDVEELALADQSFDTVVSSLSLCTFPQPLKALAEMKRVCRENGRILLLEHGRSNRGWLGRWQDRRAWRHYQNLGCQWNREPLELVSQASLKIVSAKAIFFGIFHLIEARPMNQSGQRLDLQNEKVRST